MKKEEEVIYKNVLGVLKMKMILNLLILLHVKFAKMYIHKYNKNSMSNLNKVLRIDKKNEKGNELIEPTPDAKKVCTDAITEWVIGDICPYSLVKDSELREYSQVMLYLGNKFGPNQKEINLDLSPSFGKS